jgi:hypothetical protein
MSTLEEAMTDGVVCIAPPANNTLLPAVAAQTYSRAIESLPSGTSCKLLLSGGDTIAVGTNSSFLQEAKLIYPVNITETEYCNILFIKIILKKCLMSMVFVCSFIYLVI